MTTTMTTTAIEESLTTTTESSSDAVELVSEPLELDTSKLQAHAVDLYYEVYFLDSKRHVSSQNSVATPAASVIKLFIMDYIYHLVAQGSITMEASIEGESLDALTKRMIQLSDNQATNVLINYFSMDTLNAYFQKSGYSDTQLQRLMLDETARSQGLENYTSLDDCVSYLKKLYEHKDQLVNQAMLTILKGQTIQTKIPSQLPETIEVANKTGELDTVENDVGIVFAKEPFVIVVLSNGVKVPQQMREAIGEFASAAFNAANETSEIGGKE
ncbi:hypothetical protein RV16_GL001422 [Enterococcus saccharolyticus]|nr:serine hydrolase [Enterococcus saccharolyticus]OJG84994.1 hypothetical protein RV16_GL001422 [Enterococcus saccharolyticus]